MVFTTFLWKSNASFSITVSSIILSRNHSTVYRRTIEILQRAHIFKVNCCLKVHNAHLKLASSVSDKPQEFFYCSTRFNIYTLDRLAVFPIIGVTSFLFTACFRVVSKFLCVNFPFETFLNLMWLNIIVEFRQLIVWNSAYITPLTVVLNPINGR